MKKSKKHLSRLSAYLKKEAVRLEKLISRTPDMENSALVKGIVGRLSARREIALADLGLVDAAEETMRKAPKAPKSKKDSGKKSPKKVSKKNGKPARKLAKKAVKAAPAKRAARRKPKVSAAADV
jgi:hypothetical protein